MQPTGWPKARPGAEKTPRWRAERRHVPETVRDYDQRRAAWRAIPSTFCRGATEPHPCARGTRKTAYPAPPKNTGDFARLLIVRSFPRKRAGIGSIRAELRVALRAAFWLYPRAFPVGVKRPHKRPSSTLLAPAGAFFPPAPFQSRLRATMNTLWVIVGCGVLAIVYGIWATGSVLRADAGSAQDAGNFRRRARRRAGLSQAPIHHHRAWSAW